MNYRNGRTRRRCSKLHSAPSLRALVEQASELIRVDRLDQVMVEPVFGRGLRIGRRAVSGQREQEHVPAVR